MLKKIIHYRNKIIFIYYTFLSRIHNSTLRVSKDENFIVSIASYPKRDPLLPAVFQALNSQTKPPQKYILVLSMEDYPDRVIPEYIKKLENRGVEIIWNQGNPYSVKKLVPVVEKYPNVGIVTLDDDILYHPQLLSNLLNNTFVYNGSIVGHIGKSMYRKGDDIKMMYRNNKTVDSSTPSEEIYLIGWGGIFYPPNSLHPKFKNIDKINEIVPGRGSDFWFWAAAIAAGTQQICIGQPTNFRLGIPIPLNESTKPKEVLDNDTIENRFQKTIDYFCIREKLIKMMFDKSN